jgi:hypothetical protein
MERYKELVDKYRLPFGIYEGKEMAKKERINELLLEIEFPKYRSEFGTQQQIADITTVLKLMAKDKYDVDKY